jgi:hypothetical protein
LTLKYAIFETPAFVVDAQTKALPDKWATKSARSHVHIISPVSQLQGTNVSVRQDARIAVVRFR